MTMEKRNAKMGHENAQIIRNNYCSRSCQLGCLPCPESSPTQTIFRRPQMFAGTAVSCEVTA